MVNDFECKICKDCCIVIDRDSRFLKPSGSKLDIEPMQKGKTGQSFLSSLQKSIWTCIVEGTVEYCRIVYDLFPLSYKILVLCCDEIVSPINMFDDEQQNIQQILKGFGDLGPPPPKFNSTASVFPGISQAAEELLRRPKADSQKYSKRLIVITTIEDEGDSQSIGNIVWEKQNMQDKSRCHINLLVVNIAMSKTDNVSFSRKQISPHLDVTTITMKANQCSNQLAHLTRDHYMLQSTIVTGIPMKEEQHSGTSANYDVEVIHLAATHHSVSWKDPSRDLLYQKKDPHSSVTLKWCTPKTSSTHDLQQCVGTYRVTPVEVNSRPAACLTMFLLQGRTVMLEEPKKSGVKTLTHMLSSHGGELYIHVLAYGRSALEDPPSISEGLGGRVTNYRVNDFGQLMKENRLAPFYEEEFDEPNQLAMNRLERYSKHWPMIISDTLIFNMVENLNPLLSLMMKPHLTEDEVQGCKKVIYKLQAMESRNDALPLPIVTLKGKGSKKEDQYKSLWAELETFIEKASCTSPMHKKVLFCLRGTQDPKSSADSLRSEEVGTTENASWSELERYQNMSEREKKDFNETPKRCAPSDPRRRRRVSEGCRSVEALGAQGRKSPRSPEEPPMKAKCKSNLRALGSSPLIQEKSSLLSIWTDHLKLSASRLHEDFHGQKHSVNGRYELYQKDTGTVENITAASKPVKEWV